MARHWYLLARVCVRVEQFGRPFRDGRGRERRGLGARERVLLRLPGGREARASLARVERQVQAQDAVERHPPAERLAHQEEKPADVDALRVDAEDYHRQRDGESDERDEEADCYLL